MDFDFDAIKDILVCPQSKTALVRDGDTLVCLDENCRLSYEIQEGIPIVLVDDATELAREAWDEVMARHEDSRTTGSDEPIA